MGKRSNWKGEPDPRSFFIFSCYFLTSFTFSWLHLVKSIELVSTIWDRFEAVASNQSRTQSRLSLSMYALKEFAIHLLYLDAPATEPRFGLNSEIFQQFFNFSLFIWKNGATSFIRLQFSRLDKCQSNTIFQTSSIKFLMTIRA